MRVSRRSVFSRFKVSYTSSRPRAKTVDRRLQHYLLQTTLCSREAFLKKNPTHEEVVEARRAVPEAPHKQETHHFCGLG